MDFTAIFTEHAVALERLAARITGDCEEARDVVADAFTALLSSGPDDVDHAIPWLYVTVRNRAYNQVRRRLIAKRRLPAAVAVTDTSFDPESAVRRDPLVSALVATATASLNERDRIAVSMRHLEQSSYDEIAAALGTTAMQARVVVHRANSKLRKHVVASLARHHTHARSGAIPKSAPHGRVSDELAALLQMPALLPASKRLETAIRAGWRRVESTAGRAMLHFGELVTPGMAVAAMSTAALAPVASLPPAVVPPAASHLSLPVGAGPAVPVATTGRLPRPISPPVVGHAAAPVTISPWRVEDPGLPTRNGHLFHDDDSSLLRILGLPLARFDPLDAGLYPEVDIRSLELATMADANGRPRALRWRIELAAPPTASASKVQLMWWYKDSDCFTFFEWPPVTYTHVLTMCPAVPVVGGTKGDDPHGYAAIESSQGPLRLDGTVIEGTLLFASLDDQTRALLRPGTQLVEIVMIATCPGDINLLCPSRDRAPDNGGYTYRIEQ